MTWSSTRLPDGSDEAAPRSSCRPGSSTSCTCWSSSGRPGGHPLHHPRRGLGRRDRPAQQRHRRLPRGSIRGKIDRPFGTSTITTLRGAGYRVDAAVTVAGPAARCAYGWSPASPRRCWSCWSRPGRSSTGASSTPSTGASTPTSRSASRVITPLVGADGAVQDRSRGRRHRRGLAGPRPPTATVLDHGGPVRRRPARRSRAPGLGAVVGCATRRRGHGSSRPPTSPYRVRVVRADAGHRTRSVGRARGPPRDEALRELLLQLGLAGLGALVAHRARRRPARPLGPASRSSATAGGPRRSRTGPSAGASTCPRDATTR